MKRSDTAWSSAYYPPRAGWRASLSRPARAGVRKLEAFARRLPAPTAVAWDALCIVVPGLSFYLAGWRRVGQGIFVGWVVALLVYIVCLGLPVASWAFMLLITAHTASISQRFQTWLTQQRLLTQLALGLILFGAISFLVYVPARNWFEAHLATPLPTGKRVLVMNPRIRPTSIQRGDWLAYRIEGGYRAGIHQPGGGYVPGVNVRGGFGFGPVLAVPGDRVKFGEKYFRVNDSFRVRLANMPQSGELVVSPNQWLVWPEVGVSMYGVGREVAEQAMLNIALARKDNLTGKPYQRWFFRKQTIP